MKLIFVPMLALFALWLAVSIVTIALVSQPQDYQLQKVISVEAGRSPHSCWWSP